jgi:hypothetical protein
MLKVFVLLASAVSVVGCAQTVPMTVGPDHPANPDAPAVAVVAPTTTLSIAAPATPQREGVAGGGVQHQHNHQPATASPPATAPSAQVKLKMTYVCPMHPQIVAEQPGRCPDCNMKLVKKEDTQ